MKTLTPRYDEDGNEYVRHPLYKEVWQRSRDYLPNEGAYRLTELGELVEMTAAELEEVERNWGRETDPGAAGG